jgi:ferredoxin-NADP reductase
MEFSLKQLSWIVIGSLGIGGTGYLSMANKIEDIDKRLSVVYTHMDYQSKTLDKLQVQLDRIEDKLNTTKGK